MTMERKLDKIFGDDFENVLTNIEKKIGQYGRFS